MKRRILAILAVAMASVMCITGCSSSAKESTSSEAKPTLTIGQPPLECSILY